MEKQKKTTEIIKNTEQRLNRYGNPWKHIDKTMKTMKNSKKRLEKIGKPMEKPRKKHKKNEEQ